MAVGSEPVHVHEDNRPYLAGMYRSTKGWTGVISRTTGSSPRDPRIDFC